MTCMFINIDHDNNSHDHVDDDMNVKGKCIEKENKQKMDEKYHEKQKNNNKQNTLLLLLKPSHCAL